MPLLNRQAMLDAAHDLYTMSYQDEEQERGLPISHWQNVPRLSDDVQLPIISYLMGRVHQAWGYDPGLVFHHMGFGADDVSGQSRVMYRLLMACLGHGISLDDYHTEAVSKAETVFGKAFDTSPFMFEDTEWRSLAYDVFEARIACNT